MKETANTNLVLTLPRRTILKQPNAMQLSGRAQRLQKVAVRFPATQGERAA